MAITVANTFWNAGRSGWRFLAITYYDAVVVDGRTPSRRRFDLEGAKRSCAS
jgi:hypothetical protein